MDAKELFTGMNDAALLETTTAAIEVARERGLELPHLAGSVTVAEEVELEDTKAVAEFVPATKESLALQLTPARKGYQSVIDSINGARRKNKLTSADPETLVAEFETWLTPDKLAYVNAVQETDPEVKFTLVATPSVMATPAEIIAVAKAFGKDQPYTTYVYEPVYDKYSAEQLSGTNPDNGKAVVFSLIPSKYTKSMEGTVQEQRKSLRDLQSSAPIKVPSVLEAVTFWHTLRVQNGDAPLKGSDIFDQTYIRHFNLAEQRVGGWAFVPYSYVYAYGKPILSSSGVDLRHAARLSVG